MGHTTPTIYEICNSLIPPFNRSVDEYLAQLSNCPPLIPLIQRDENFKLPDSDLLNAIHYYLSTNIDCPKNIFDESALLFFGFLIEHWIDEIIGNDVSLFEEFEFDNKKKSKRKTKEC